MLYFIISTSGLLGHFRIGNSILGQRTGRERRKQARENTNPSLPLDSEELLRKET